MLNRVMVFTATDSQGGDMHSPKAPCDHRFIYHIVYKIYAVTPPPLQNLDPPLSGTGGHRPLPEREAEGAEQAKERDFRHKTTTPSTPAPPEDF